MPAPKKRPAWIDETGLISVGFWEPLYFLKYRGGHATNVEADYASMHSDTSLDGLAAAGINLSWVHFFKGFGLDFEREEMLRAKDYIARAHKRGLKVGTYVTLGSLTPETLLLEESAAQNWFQVNQDGQAPSCQTSHQCFRVRPCYNSEGYLRYMERVCAYAIECGADMIHFDNIGYNAEPDTCHCPICVVAFREMLRGLYGTHNDAARAAGQARFGHNNFTHVRPPSYNRWNQAIDQRRINVPHQQEWVRFKVKSLTQSLSRLSHFIERKNPECAVEANLFKAFGENTDWLHGINYAEQLPHLDYAFSEEPHKPGKFNKHGAALSRMRTYKTARAFEIAVQVYNEGRTLESYEISLAENLAFNPRGLGHFGTPHSGFWAPGQAATVETDPRQKLTKQYFDFYRLHRAELYLRTKSLARVAVFRDTPSLAWNSVETHLTQINLEQNLLEWNVAFDLLYAPQLKDLSKYRAIVLPNAECLSDELLATFKHYVEGGGGLVLLENTGRFDEWRRERVPHGLTTFFGDEFNPRTPIRKTMGEGRVIFLPNVEHFEQPSTRPEVWFIFNEYWAAPKNAHELMDGVFTASGELPWTVKAAAGRPLADGFLTPSGARALHVLNLDPHQPLRNLECSIELETAPAQILPLSPTWTYEPIPFHYDADRRRAYFGFNELKRYVLFKIS